MEQILFIRENMISFYKRFENYILFIGKFLFGLIIFSLINNIGFAREEVIKYVSPPIELPLSLLLGLLFAVTPTTMAYLLVILMVTLQLSAYIEVAAIVLLVLICLMVFYVRLDPRRSMLILAMVLAYYFKIPYFIPLFAGLYYGLVSIVPITIGVFVWSFIPIIKKVIATSTTAGLDFMEIPSTFGGVFEVFLKEASLHTDWIFIAFVFAMTVVAVSIISRLSIDYSKDLSIGLGAALNIIAFIILVLIVKLDIGILGLIFSTLISATIVIVIHFFDIVLDYSQAESVQFQDEDNYYYVKVIPKIVMTKRKRVVKRIRSQEE